MWKRTALLVAIVIAVLVVLGGVLLYRKTVPQYTSMGLPLYPGASEITAAPENLPVGVDVEVYRTSASDEKVVSWMEERMNQQGWKKERSERGRVILSWWEKEGRGVTVVIGPAEEMGRIFGIKASGTVFLFLTGDWTTISGLETKNLAPPSVQTSQPTGVESTYATLNARINYGGYSSVKIRFRYREVGGTWKYTPWETCDRSYYDYRVSELGPGRRYEFEAQIEYENRIDGGGILEFGTKGVEDNLSTPFIQTGMAVGVTETSAILTATITYGNYQRVDVCFRWREVGGSWNYVPWYPNFTGPSCYYRLATLSPGRTYEFQALLRYDGKEVLGEIRSFTTPRPRGGMSITATVRGVYFPEMSFAARLTPDQKVLLTVRSGENLQAGEWEWRAENEDGPITPFVAGTEPLFPGSSVLLDVSSLVRAGSLGVGDWIGIRHSPSGFFYPRVTISP